jgi:hypothetical protein
MARMLRRRFTLSVASLSIVAAVSWIAFAQPKAADLKPQWSMNATIIEACSCPMFCQCYFDTKPAAPGGHGGHSHGDSHGDHAAAAAGGEHYCKFNNAFRVNTGHWGDTKLDGAKFWIAGDLGHDFSQGKMNWAVLFFDPSVTKEQRDAITKIAGHVYPAEWKSFTIGKDAKIDWSNDGEKAVAKADGGRVAEVVLKKFPGMTKDPVVMMNLKYWGVPRNDGFVMMPNEIQTLRVVPEGQKAYEFKGTNGFMITFDINSNDVGKKG